MNHFQATYASAYAARETLLRKVLLACPDIDRDLALRNLPDLLDGHDRVVAIGAQIAIEVCARAL